MAVQNDCTLVKKYTVSKDNLLTAHSIYFKLYENRMKQWVHCTVHGAYVIYSNYL